MTYDDLLEEVRYKLWYTYFSDKEKIDRIITAMKKADRLFFIEDHPYKDCAGSIGESQTISQPSTVALMLLFLDIKKKDYVLEVGSGSGWNAAVMSFLARKVMSYEVIPSLVRLARKNFNKIISQKNVEFKEGNVFDESFKEKFEKIIFTAGIRVEDEYKIEQFAKKRLKERGRLVCPYQEGPLLIIEMKGNKLIKRYSDEKFAFVKLRI